MFGNNKSLEKENEQLKQRNADLVAAMEELSRTHSTDFVIKLIPECSDQFYIDGEFIADDCKAVYGSHHLSFSEAVCWKAGKEVARRAYEQLIAEAEQSATASAASSKGSEDRVASLQKELDNLKQEYAQDMEISKGIREKLAVAERSIEVLRNSIEDLTAGKEAAEASRSEYHAKYLAAKEQLDRLTSFEPSDAVFTSCGVVVTRTA